jgi:hypothetical protein
MVRTLLRNDANKASSVSTHYVLRPLPSPFFFLSIWTRSLSFHPICVFHSATGSCVTKWAMPFYSTLFCSVLLAIIGRYYLLRRLPGLFLS